jgi:hypothetical protein
MGDQDPLVETNALTGEDFGREAMAYTAKYMRQASVRSRAEIHLLAYRDDWKIGISLASFL